MSSFLVFCFSCAFFESNPPEPETNDTPATAAPDEEAELEVKCEPLEVATLIWKRPLGAAEGSLSILPAGSECNASSSSLAELWAQDYEVVGHDSSTLIVRLLDYGTSIVLLDMKTGDVRRRYEEPIAMIFDHELQAPSLKDGLLTLPHVNISGQTPCADPMKLKACLRKQAAAQKIDISRIKNPSCGPKVIEAIQSNLADEVLLSAHLVVSVDTLTTYATEVSCYISS